MSETLTRPGLQIACYGSTPEQHKAGEGKLTGESPTYLRYGSTLHSQLEDRVAELAQVDSNDLLIFNNGLSAIDATLDAVIDTIQRPDGKRPKIAIAAQLYGGTTRLITKKARRQNLRLGVFDAGDSEDIQDALSDADVVFLENVTNAPGQPVIDHKAVIDTQRRQSRQPYVIFDRTLPLATECDVYDCIEPEDNTVIVESATKAYVNNADKLGFIATKNQEIKQAIRAERNDGSIPGIGSSRFALDLLPSAKEFEARNKRLFANVGIVAVALHEASLDSDLNFTVDHPSLAHHVNYGQSHVQSHGDISPVIFLNPIAKKGEDKQQVVSTFASQLADNPLVDPHIQRSDSFAFGITAIHSAADLPYVRVAPGYNIDPTEVANALYSALTK